MSSKHFADEVANKVSDSCILCEKPTQSHVILTRPEPETESLQPGTKEEWKEGIVLPFLLCHTCYAERDGDASVILDEYTEMMKDAHAGVGLDFGDQLEVMLDMIAQDEMWLCPSCGWMASTETPDGNCMDCGGDLVLEKGRDAVEGNEYTL